MLNKSREKEKETQARKVTTEELEDLLRATDVLAFETTEHVEAYKKMGLHHKLPDDLKDPEAFFKGLSNK